MERKRENKGKKNAKKIIIAIVVLFVAVDVGLHIYGKNGKLNFGEKNPSYANNEEQKNEKETPTDTSKKDDKKEDNTLNGTYSYDNNTKYVFNGKGKGSLNIQEGEYKYTYKVEGSKLSIDFKNEDLYDATYEYKIEGDTLTLIGGEGTASVGTKYILTKVK